MHKKKSLLILLVLIISSFVIFSPTVMAIGDPITDPDAYKPGGINGSDTDIVASKAGVIFNTITTVGVITAVITIIVIGIKYMVGSVEEKAEYKKTMVPYLVGAIMLVCTSAIVKLIANMVEGLG